MLPVLFLSIYWRSVLDQEITVDVSVNGSIDQMFSTNILFLAESCDLSINFVLLSSSVLACCLFSSFSFCCISKYLYVSTLLRLLVFVPSRGFRSLPSTIRHLFTKTNAHFSNPIVIPMSALNFLINSPSS